MYTVRCIKLYDTYRVSSFLKEEAETEPKHFNRLWNHTNEPALNVTTITKKNDFEVNWQMTR